MEEGEAEEAEEEEKERKREKFIGRRRRRRWINQNKRCERCLPSPPTRDLTISSPSAEDRHIVFTDVLFNLIDVENDGKISPAESAVYTDLFFKMTVNDDWGKGQAPERIHDQDHRNQSCLHHTLLAICMVVTVYNIIVDKIIKDLNVPGPCGEGGVGGESREVY